MFVYSLDEKGRKPIDPQLITDILTFKQHNDTVQTLSISSSLKILPILQENPCSWSSQKNLADQKRMQTRMMVKVIL